ncbi:Nucleoside-diphosphate-sugar epimerase [Mesorhizobium albiziae]|uniref:Nucleoside-diphosphate-sugar epimerase n=1 Tax=Neomesorhizobium albiziae TaxID=335020 RepID=A0A1I3ZDY5_9HYPH|nr:NAD(P)-dependent oxidoreductase [Mesorhizobium albiziae]GLS32172.1 UDP-glucose 4-epimerase [Mesorhizobium albiziae]SFK42364.1 Nucleoside-diphosphate-sugar epimerase [Mesorhizobium albiziae]
MTATLVSGGTGFVGRFIVENLLAAGHAVTVMGRTAPPQGFFSAPVRFVEGTLDPSRDQSAAFDGIDCFIHAAFDHVAGKYRGGEGDDAAGFRFRNREGSAALFAAAKARGVSRAVFLSSRAVYGTQPAGALLDEETPPHPDTLYGQVKLASEEDLKAMSGADFCGASLRVTGVYGPGGHGREDKWADLFRDYLAGRPILPRAGTEVHGDDVGAAVRLMLEAPEPKVSGEIFNVSDLLVDRHDLLSMLRDSAGSLHPLPDRADHSAANVMATAKIRALGWRPGGVASLENFVRSQAAG